MRWPAIVRSVDRARREVRVEIPGKTDGAEEWPIAEIEYPIGDKGSHTEIRIIEGDLVWVTFIGNDPRYPIITGSRLPHTGNEVGTRRWHHDNIETDADEAQTHTAGTVYTVSAPLIDLGEEGSLEPSVLGDKLSAWINSELLPWLNAHNHIGNLGIPTSAALLGSTGPFEAGTAAPAGAVYSTKNRNQ